MICGFTTILKGFVGVQGRNGFQSANCAVCWHAMSESSSNDAGVEATADAGSSFDSDGAAAATRIGLACAAMVSGSGCACGSDAVDSLGVASATSTFCDVDAAPGEAIRDA